MSFVKLIGVAAPTAPAAEVMTLYRNSATDRLEAIDSDGVVYILSENGVRQNMLGNAGFTFAQRQAPATLTTYSNTTGRTFGADLWGMTNENASVQYQRVDSIGATESGLNARYYGKLKKITSAGKMIVSQVIEATNTAPLRGRTVRVQCKMRYTVAASMTVRLGLLQLTSAGTTDAMPATFASAFGAVGTDPTWGTNLTAVAPATVNDNGSISGNGITCVLTSGWLLFSGTFAVTSTTKNLVMVIWTNGQPAANDELNVAECGVYDGGEEREWQPMDYGEDMAVCQRSYCKTFDVDTAPIQNAGLNTGEFRFDSGIAAAGAESSSTYFFPVPMRLAPTTNTSYNPAVANAQVRDVSKTADCSATAFAGVTTRGCYITCTGNATTIVGDSLGVHLSFDASI